MPIRPDNASAATPVGRPGPFLKEREMPKLKTKSSVKKRHNLRKRSQKMKRQARGMEIMRPEDERIVRKFMPYG